MAPIAMAYACTSALSHQAIKSKSAMPRLCLKLMPLPVMESSGKCRQYLRRHGKFLLRQIVRPHFLVECVRVN